MSEHAFVIYRGSQYEVVCVAGLHHRRRTADGFLEPIHGSGGSCRTWAGGCPAERLRQAGHTTDDYRTCACENCDNTRDAESCCRAEAINAEILERPRGEVPTDPGDLPEPGSYS